MATKAIEVYVSSERHIYQNRLTWMNERMDIVFFTTTQFLRFRLKTGDHCDFGIFTNIFLFFESWEFSRNSIGSGPNPDKINQN